MYSLCFLLFSSVSAAQQVTASSSGLLPLDVIILWCVLALVLCYCLYLLIKNYALKLDKHRLNALWKNIPFVITEVNQTGEILAVNHALGDELDIQKLVGTNSYDYLSETDQKVFRKCLQDALRLGEQQEYEIQAVLPDGVHYLQNKIVPLTTGDELQRAMVISIDISDRKDAEKILMQARTVAEDNAKEKSQFLANMSHEIRTPLNGIIGLIELIEESNQLSEVQELLPPLLSSTQHLNRIVDDVLELAKSDSGQLKLEEIEVSLWQILDDLEALYGPQCEQKQLVFTIVCQPDVPRMVVMDAFRLRQVLYNLMSNALKFTEQGSIQLKIESILVAEQALLKFTVQDSGVGIQPDMQTQIFDAFQQAKISTQREHGGTGLGLSICKNLVAIMGGLIGVDSELNQGASFWFTINLKAAADYPSLQIIPSGSVYLAIKQPQAMAWFKQFFKMLNVSTISIDHAESIPETASLLVSDHLLGVYAKHCWWLAEEFNPHATVLSEPYRREALFLQLLNYEQEANPNMETSGHISQQVCHLLLVEDNLTNQLVVRKTLEKIGYRITIANNGQEGVDTFTEHEFNGVIMDIQMPVMDGIEATRRIRQIPGRYVPIIALTANGQKEIEEACFAVGMDAYLNKPLNRVELQTTLERLLGDSINLNKESI